MLRRRITKRLIVVAAGVLGLVILVGREGEAVAEEPLVGTLETMDPRAIGLGGALRASASGTSGVYLNPAVIAMSPIYHLELLYQFTGQEKMHSGGLSVVDSVTARIAAGLSFTYSGIRQPHSEHDAFDGRLALASAIGDSFFLGATGRYIHVENNVTADSWGPAGVAALPPSGSQQVDGMTFDVGAALRAGDLITLGLVGYNLTDTGSVYAPIKLGGGLSVYLIEMLLLELDSVVDFTSHHKSAWEIRFGAELFIAEQLGIRAGYVLDTYYQMHSISAGIGYVDSRFSIDFGFLREAKAEGRTVLAFGFKYFVN